MNLKDQIAELQKKADELKAAVPLDVVELGKVQAQLADLISQQAFQGWQASVQGKSAQEQLTSLQSTMQDEKAKGADRNAGLIALLEKNEAVLLEEIMHQGEKEQRVQAQEEKVQSITLPYDFNDIFENKAANEIIIEVVQQFQRQAYDEHNKELEQIKTDFREQLRAADERETQLKRQNDELQASAQKAVDELFNKNNEVTDLQQRLKNAADQLDEKDAEISRLNSHIDDLRAENALGARQAVKVMNVENNDRLSELVKNAKVKTSLELALERGAGTAATTLQLPNIKLPTANEVFPKSGPVDQANVGSGTSHSQEVTFPEVPNGHGVAHTALPTAGEVPGVTKQEHEALKADHEALKAQVTTLAADVATLKQTHGVAA